MPRTPRARLYVSVLSPVDLATGKANAYFFLNPDDILDKSLDLDMEWRDINMFIPGVLVENSGKEAKLRLPDNKVVRVASSGLVAVSRQDKEGVMDILHLDNFSEQSLLHTIRARFERVRSERAVPAPAFAQNIAAPRFPLTPDAFCRALAGPGERVHVGGADPRRGEPLQVP